MHVSFLYVNIIALCSFTILFITALAVKKTPEIWAFLALLLDCLFWSGGATFMRLQLRPGLYFWYAVSLTALLLLELFFYLFVRVFTRQKDGGMLWILTAVTLAVIPGTASGYFQPAPEAILLENGELSYLYTYSSLVAVPVGVCLLTLGATVVLMVRTVRRQGRTPGLHVVLVSGIALLAGNLLQITRPGDPFPYDALAGIIFAGLLAVALYRQRIFQMTLMISRGLLTGVLATICVVAAATVFPPVQNNFLNELAMEPRMAATASAMVFAVVLVAVQLLLQRLVNGLFTREEREDRLIKEFSTNISRELNTANVVEQLANVAAEEVAAENIYVCLLEDGFYQVCYAVGDMASSPVSIPRDSPCITHMKARKEGERRGGYLLFDEIQGTPLEREMMTQPCWEALRKLHIDCMVAIEDGGKIMGLMLISGRYHSRRLNVVELGFLETVCSIASIAMKNAALYEKMFREARIDSLTGAYNYRYYIQALEKEFTRFGEKMLTLLYINVDDFKLYNQLYGVRAGDEALYHISQVITRVVGDRGIVARSSGKVFAVLLPGVDADAGKEMAELIQAQVRAINEEPGRQKFKQLTVSVGLCSAPHAAGSAKELMDNADMAAYTAKRAGKNQLQVFQGAAELMPQQLGERTEAIVSRIERGEGEYGGALPTLLALTAAIDAKDHYTYAHSKNVAKYAATLAVAAGLNDEQVRTTYTAGLLHDIGKISIPESLLHKTGKLGPDEYEIMKGHVNNSIEIIRHLPQMDYLIPAVLGHHERWDGGGYSRGISGEEIPITARCLALADVFDAMTTTRPYRQALAPEYAIEEIEKMAGTQFDPELAATFADLLRSESIPMQKIASGQ